MVGLYFGISGFVRYAVGGGGETSRLAPKENGAVRNILRTRFRVKTTLDPFEVLYAMKLVSKTSGNDYMVCNVGCMDTADITSPWA